VGACISEGAAGERECAGMGHCVRDGGTTCGGGGGGGVGACAEEEGGGGKGEGGDEDGGKSGWRGKGGEERALDRLFAMIASSMVDMGCVSNEGTMVG